MTTRVLDRPQALMDALTDVCGWASDLYLAYAWLHSNGGRGAHWQCVPRDKIRMVVAGIDFAQTEPEALRRLGRTGSLRVVDDVEGVFHPKVLVGVHRGRARAIVGSSNFTAGGFDGNVELNLLIEGARSEPPLSTILAFIEDLWAGPRSFEPSGAWLAQYEKLHSRRPRPPRRKAKAGGRSKPIRPGKTDLSVGWDEYFRKVNEQQGRPLARGGEIHVFEHPDGSFLQVVEKCQAAFRQHPSLQVMPRSLRQHVAGFGPGSGFFGRMGGAGNYKNLINERPEEISQFLEAIPLSGAVTRAQAAEYLRGATALYGVSLATGTRLLAMKRPDRFMAVNNANRKGLRAQFGTVPQDVESYLALHDRLWKTPWFRSPRPDGRNEVRVWNARVALIDTMLYDND